ncbi:4901_t:CDS:2 [Funneliformis caledonium]|uniref:4901_t:CDS:1 n=1 Tax=Funneliformis caledonium TaxID=1117310 RepID=A0A9N9G789_9GLOM|nr:4901_t:CDS:2 [Funneliformis caledonium]
MSTASATTDLKLNDEKKRRKMIKIPKFLKSIRKRASNLSEALKPITTEILNPTMTETSHSETIESLYKYETLPGQTQKFLADEESALEFDNEIAFNLIFFYDNIDKGIFNEHKDEWVLVYKQQLIKYRPEYTRKKLKVLEEEMPGAIYLPVDKSRRDDLLKSLLARTVSARHVNQEHMIRIQVRRTGTTNSVILEYNFNDPVEGNKLYKSVIDSDVPEMTLLYHVCSTLGKQGWRNQSMIANRYGHPNRIFYASDTFEVSIGNNNRWSKWVGIDTLRVWQRRPDNKIDNTGMQTDNNSFSDKAVQTDSLDKATQTEGIDFLEQIKKANILLTDAISILSNI